MNVLSRPPLHQHMPTERPVKKRIDSNLFRAVAGLALICSCNNVRAANACVNNTLQLALVLNAAQNNNQPDDIRVEIGTYPLGSELSYLASASELQALTISGGWAPGCATPSSTGDTILDGQNLVRSLYIQSNGQVNIRRLSFVNGNPAQYAGGAINISGNANSVFRIESNVFVSNDCVNVGGALYVATLGTIHLSSNLFVANAGATAGAVYLDGGFFTNTYVVNNTLVANQLPNGQGLGALVLAGPGHYEISNNVLWNNQGNDLYAQAGETVRRNNDIGTTDGLPPLNVLNEISVDPNFNGFLSFLPAPGSPLIDAGFDAPPGGLGFLGVDAAGAPRLQDQHVDIGAYETSNLLFRNGFEP